MKRFIQLSIALLTCVFLFGCARPITMNPDLALVTGGGVAKINKTAGYYISDDSKVLEVTTPGGGGDKIRYFPYRDLEPGLYKALSEVFTSVNKVKDPKDGAALKAANINILITPSIATTSSSPSAFTWPPTKFGVDMLCTIQDGDGKVLETIRVNGEGKAEFDEFKANFSLAAVRASDDVLAKLIKALRESKEIQK